MGTFSLTHGQVFFVLLCVCVFLCELLLKGLRMIGLIVGIVRNYVKASDCGKSKFKCLLWRFEGKIPTDLHSFVEPFNKTMRVERSWKKCVVVCSGGGWWRFRLLVLC